MLEVHRNIVAANVRGHRNDGRMIELPDEMSGGNAVQIRHDDIHEHQIVF